MVCKYDILCYFDEIEIFNNFSSPVDMLYDDTHANSVIPDEKYRWKGGIIPYVIDCSLERLPDAMRSIKAAMKEWEAKTCIRFVKKTNEKKFLTFFR